MVVLRGLLLFLGELAVSWQGAGLATETISEIMQPQCSESAKAGMGSYRQGRANRDAS